MKGPSAVVGVKELREDASALIAAVEKGEWFVLSKRRNLVGVLLPSAMVANLINEYAIDVIALQLSGRRDKRA